MGSRPGLSLFHAFRPKEWCDLEQTLADLRCGACGLTSDQKDLGLLRNRGFLLFYEIIKTCSCGFATRVFAVVNDCLRHERPHIATSEKAFATAESADLIENPELQEGFYDLVLAHHQGDTAKALECAEALSLNFPDDADCWYNLGWLYGECGRVTEASAAYARACALQPEMADAWFNRAAVLAKCGAYEAARRCLDHYRTLRPDDTDTPFEATTFIETQDGLYGKIIVADEGPARRLSIADQFQSSIYLKPTAEAFIPGAGYGPGAVPETLYVLAWIAAAIKHPEGRGLMLGLGSGAGAVILLTHFPKLTLTVVESDPKVSAMIQSHFPLVQAFVDAGRLKILTIDARDFEPSDYFQFTVMDLYRGSTRMPEELITPDFFRRITAADRPLWINLIAKAGEPYYNHFFDVLREAGFPAKTVMGTTAPIYWEKIDANWIVATEPVNPQSLSQFELFPMIRDCAEVRRADDFLKALSRYTYTGEVPEKQPLSP